MTCADKVYKVWDLKNYEHLYSIHDNNIYEIKISPVPARCSRFFLLAQHAAEERLITVVMCRVLCC